MSRIGKQPIDLLEGVSVEVLVDTVIVNGPMGTIKLSYLNSNLSIKVEDGKVILERKDESKFSKSIHGTMRNIIYNAINGVKNGYSKKLNLSGVGYRAFIKGDTLSMILGYTHPVEINIPNDIKIEVKDETEITLTGIDKQRVNQFAALIRDKRRVEPYKGKGITYEGEFVRRKSGKKVA